MEVDIRRIAPKDYAERVKWDSEKKEFVIERTYNPTAWENTVKLPLTQWQLVKAIPSEETEENQKPICLLVKRIIPSESPYQREKTLFFRVDVAYKIDNRLGKFVYLKREKSKNPDSEEIVTRVYLCDLETGSTKECPIPNTEYVTNPIYHELDVKLLSKKRVSVEDASKLMHGNGDVDCLGLYSEDMSLKILQDWH